MRTAGYDYIIVGAGSAGFVRPARLPAESGVSVFVIEAGPAGRVDAPAIAGDAVDRGSA